MSEVSRAFSPGRLSSGALYALVVLAPLFGGSSSLETLIGLALGWAVAAALLLQSTRRGGRRLAWPGLALGLALLGLYSALQALPLPLEWLRALSPRAHELRSFALPEATRGSLSYEPGASWREAAKFLLYAGVFVVAHHRARARSGLEGLASSALVAGLAVLVTGLVHRALGADRVFGVVDTLVPMSQSLTTFSNPNHAAGFLSLAAFAGIGLALEARGGRGRLVHGLGAAICLLGSLAAFSRAGLVATFVAGLGLSLALLSLRRRRGEPIGPSSWAAAAGLGLASAAALLFLRAPEVGRELEGVERGQVLGLAEKLAAVRDSIPMTLEHPWTGIGRGAYASLYTLYKTSTYQLTFAFPENVAAQLASEWGLLVGGAALLGLGFALALRLLRARSALTLAIVIGVSGLLLHNLLDFSLELAGVAVPVAALLGGASARALPSPRLALEGWGAQVASLAGLCAAIGVCLGLALTEGELFRDLRAVSALVSSAEGRSRPAAASAGAPELEVLLARHPVNALLAVQAAYAAENASPPDHRRAIALANRAMYLAPTYAEGYFIAGRVLLRLGHRDQGLGLLRTAWTLSSRPQPIVEHVAWSARTAEEVRRALPRTDAERDRVSVPALVRAAHALRANGRRQEALELLRSLDRPEGHATEDLLSLAQLALAQRELTLAGRFLRPLLGAEAAEPRALVLWARILELEDRREELRALLDRMEHTKGVDQRELLLLRLRADVKAEDFEAARAALKRLEQAAPPTYAAKAEVALEAARLELAAGRRGHALSVLSQTLELVPEDHRLRLLRAQLLESEGRTVEAMRDLELVLRVRPQHVGAQRTLSRLRRAGSEPGAER